MAGIGHDGVIDAERLAEQLAAGAVFAASSGSGSEPTIRSGRAGGPGFRQIGSSATSV